jgi:hypothetical protein
MIWQTNPSKIFRSANLNETTLCCELLEERRMLATFDVFAAGATGEETMEVRLFDRVLATFENVGGDFDNGVFEKFTFEVDFESGELGDEDDLFVAFTNDLYIAGEVDRNLRVDAIVLSEIDGSTDDPIRYETEASGVYSTGTWKPEDGIVRGYRESEILHTNGFFNFSRTPEGSTRIVIEAKGSEGGEQFDLQIDGQTVESFTVAQNSEFYTWTGPADQRIDYDQVRIVFTNDEYDPENGIDRNLVVEDVSVGRFFLRDFAIRPERSGTVFSTGTWLPEDGIQPGIRFSDTLHSNGYFQFGVFDETFVDDDPSNPGIIYEETFENGNAGWTFDPFGSDTADQGQWEIGNADATSINGEPFQLGQGFVGNRSLVTGLNAGSGIGNNDVDGGVTSALSPEIDLPSDAAQLRVAYNFAHTRSATFADQLRIGVLVDGQLTNILTLGANEGATRNGGWEEVTIFLGDYADQSIQLLVEAEDETNTVVEAAIGRMIVETV